MQKYPISTLFRYYALASYGQTDRQANNVRKTTDNLAKGTNGVCIWSIARLTKRSCNKFRVKP